jgi:hypothetical protein
MLDKTKVSRMVKTHILSLVPPPLFAHFKGDREHISLKTLKKGRGIKDTRNFCFIKHMPKMSGFPNKSSFVITVPLPFSSPL